MNEPERISAFLEAEGWGDATALPLKADFSTRKFIRLERETSEPRRAILMQAAHDQKTPQFIAIGGILRRCSLSAPEIYASAINSPSPLEIEGTRAKRAGARGIETAYDFVLMQDFGDATFGTLMDSGSDPLPLCRRATNVLEHLHKTFDPAWAQGHDLPVFDSAAFAAQAELFLDFYVPFALKRAATGEERESFRAAWLEVLKPLDALPRTLMLRDFMPDNLMDLPGQEGLRSTGLLDFQDGGLGPIAYDIASLCECVRRDVPTSLMDEIIEYYHRQNPIVPLSDLRRACRILSAQRHTRVLGIVTRLAQKDDQTDKLAHIPRIQGYLGKLMQEESLRPVRLWADALMK